MLVEYDDTDESDSEEAKGACVVAPAALVGCAAGADASSSSDDDGGGGGDGSAGARKQPRKDEAEATASDSGGGGSGNPAALPDLEEALLAADHRPAFLSAPTAAPFEHAR